MGQHCKQEMFLIEKEVGRNVLLVGLEFICFQGVITDSKLKQKVPYYVCF